MVTDTSSLLAILQDEPERESFLAAIEKAGIRLISVVSVGELSMVVLSRRSEEGLTVLQGLLEDLQIEQASVSTEHAALAIEGFRRFGKGRHRAALNLGDCFAYALAKATGEPLLFKGDDFSRTDIKRAA